MTEEKEFKMPKISINTNFFREKDPNRWKFRYEAFSTIWIIYFIWSYFMMVNNLKLKYAYIIIFPYMGLVAITILTFILYRKEEKNEHTTTTGNTELKWKAEEKKATAKQLWALAGIIAAVGLGVALYLLFKQPDVVNTIQPLANQTIAVINPTT